MGFWGWISLIFFIIVGWNLIQWGIRVNDEAKAEEETREIQRKRAIATSEMERVRSEVIQELNKMWGQARREYEDAIRAGDKFMATAKGRDFYARNRRFGGTWSQDQMIADEIRIKNEVASGGVGAIDPLRLDALDFEELRDRVASIAK